MADAMPNAANMYGLIRRNRNARYPKSTSAFPLASARNALMPKTTRIRPRLKIAEVRTRRRPSSFSPPAVAIANGVAREATSASERVSRGRRDGGTPRASQWSDEEKAPRRAARR